MNHFQHFILKPIMIKIDRMLIKYYLNYLVGIFNINKYIVLIKLICIYK